MKMNNTARSITAAAIVGAAYAALTMLLAPISYGAIQVRVSEALCILPYFLPCTAWGLFAGCAIANVHPEVFAPNALYIFLGEAAVMYLIGLPLMRYLPEKKFFRDLIEKFKD